MHFTIQPLFVSSPEIMVIIVIIVVIFGANKIPEIAHGLGKGIRQIKNATNDIKSEIQKSADDCNLKKEIEDVKKCIDGVKEDIKNVTKPIKRK